MKNNSHNAKQAPSKAAKPKHDNDVNKAKPKRVKKESSSESETIGRKERCGFYQDC